MSLSFQFRLKPLNVRKPWTNIQSTNVLNLMHKESVNVKLLDRFIVRKQNAIECFII